MTGPCSLEIAYTALSSFPSSCSNFVARPPVDYTMHTTHNLDPQTQQPRYAPNFPQHYSDRIRGPLMPHDIPVDFSLLLHPYLEKHIPHNKPFKVAPKAQSSRAPTASKCSCDASRRLPWWLNFSLKALQDFKKFLTGGD